MRANGKYKIGKSENPERRLEDFRTGNLDIVLMATLDKDIEGVLHEKFSSKNIELEWFNFSCKEIDSIVEEFGFNPYNDQCIKTTFIEAIGGVGMNRETFRLGVLGLNCYEMDMSRAFNLGYLISETLCCAIEDNILYQVEDGYYRLFQMYVERDIITSVIGSDYNDEKLDIDTIIKLERLDSEVSTLINVGYLKSYEEIQSYLLKESK